ncbi:MAG: 5'/3'-nucleotidase SurE [Acidimicrobiales bacterium]
MLRRTIAIAVGLTLSVAACGSDGDDASPATEPTTADASTTTTAAPEPLLILVTNDDGIGAPGIDALVNGLLELDGVELEIVAPAENQSGSSDKTTEGGAPYAAGATASGVAGTAVQGFPADTIAVAIDELGLVPDLVVSGVNEGQNTGSLAYVSGTVGAARTAVRRGIPAIAGSAGLGEDADYATAVELMVAYIDEHRAELAEGGASEVVSFNVPDCIAGSVKEVLEVPLAAVIPEGVNPFESDCSIEPATPPADDVAAVAAGYVALTLVPPEAPAG